MIAAVCSPIMPAKQTMYILSLLRFTNGARTTWTRSTKKMQLSFARVKLVADIFPTKAESILSSNEMARKTYIWALIPE